jgi:hypothetical protein
MLRTSACARSPPLKTKNRQWVESGLQKIGGAQKKIQRPLLELVFGLPNSFSAKCGTGLPQLIPPPWLGEFPFSRNHTGRTVRKEEHAGSRTMPSSPLRTGRHQELTMTLHIYFHHGANQGAKVICLADYRRKRLSPRDDPGPPPPCPLGARPVIDNLTCIDGPAPAWPTVYSEVA